MKTDLHPLPRPRDAALPLRDLIRGLRRGAAAPRAALEPVLDLLPGPFRSALHRLRAPIAAELDGLLRTGLPDAALMARARQALAGGGREEARAADIGEALAYGATVLLAEAGESGLMVSETVAALAWSETEGLPDAPARLAKALDRHDVFGVAPGLARASARVGKAQARRIHAATVVWLLAEPPEAPAEEPQLIHLAALLLEAEGDDLQAAWPDTARLARLLADTAARV